MEPDPQASQSADPESGSPSLFSRRKTPLLLSQFHAAVSVRQRGRRRDAIPGEKNSDMSGDPGRVDVTERRGNPSETPRSW
ncbi:hypothetical protein F7725_006399 [Dissostichus mawsoni]|uniref:Uncharacterized protein n=1 Tax=Dissostichus mawsoni TaxID=36200 RepID=A0A7J5XVG9_DISMA|nr:hypothetical protein F7725_006399 [Dissostichus mawsoni]